MASGGNCQAEDRVRAALAAETAPLATGPLPAPPHHHRRPGWRLRWHAWRMGRRHLPVSRSGVIAVYLLWNAILLGLALLLIRHYGIRIDWARFAGTWKP